MHQRSMTVLVLFALLALAWPARATSVFSSNFESGSLASEGWTAANGSEASIWACGTATNNGGIYGAYISNDNGATNSYTTTSPAISHLYRDVTFPLGETSITLTFDWRGQGESGFDYLRVFLVPSSTTPVAGSQLKVGQVGAMNYNMSSTYATATIAIPCSVAGTTQRLVFSWRNDGARGAQFPAAIDNITLSTAGGTPVTGTYTIDNTQPTGGTNFRTFTAAISALNLTGVAVGGASFDVQAGQVFAETPPALSAACAAGPIVFHKFGGGPNPVIRPTGGIGTSDCGLCVSGTDNVTIDGIDVSTNGGSSVEYGILLRNASPTDGAQNCVIRNCRITLSRANTASIGIVQSSSASLGAGVTPTAAIGANSGNKYYNITVENAYRGMYLCAGSATYPDLNCEIGTADGGTTTIGAASANDIGNGGASSWGIRAVSQRGLRIFGTTIRNVTVTGPVNIYGIYLDNSLNGSLGSVEISGCTIRDLKSMSNSSAVLYGLRADISSGNSGWVYNNDIFSLTPASPGLAGPAPILRALCGNMSGTGTVSFYHNSVRVDQGTSLNGSSAAFYFGGGKYDLQNNIIANVTGAQARAKHWGAYISSGTPGIVSNNIIYTPNMNGVLGYCRGSDRSLREMFAAAISSSAPVDGQDGGSANADPIFVGATDLNFAGSTPAAGSGVPIAGITTDIAGATRGTPPDIGAHETANALSDASAPVLSSVGVTSGDLPTVSVTLADNSAAANNAIVRLWYRLGTSGAFTGVDADSKSIGAMNGTYSWSTSFSGLAAGSYQFYVAARDVRGPGRNLGVNPIWRSSFPGTGGWAVSDPPNFGTNPATFANTRTFTKTSTLGGGVYPVGSDEPVLKKLTDVAGLVNDATLTGDVIFELKPTYDGTVGETFPIVFNQYVVSGGSWTVTIRPRAGAGMRTTAGTSASAIIKLSGADRVILDGREGGTGTSSAWTITNTSISASTAAIWLSSLGPGAGAVGNTLAYLTLSCGVDPVTSRSETFDIVSSGASISTLSAGMDSDDNTYLGNTLTRARWGIYLRGASGNLNDNAMVSSNLVGPATFGGDEIGKGGIVLQYQNLATVTQNVVRCVGALRDQTAPGTDRVGIGLGDCAWIPTATAATNCTITRNTIRSIVDEKTYSAVGLVVAGTGTPSANIVANNVVYDVRANGTSGDQAVGIGIGAGDGDKVVYNTISLSGDLDPSTQSGTESGVGIRIASNAVSNLTLKDNVVAMDVTSNTATLKHYAIVAPAASYAWGSGGANNNDYYVNPANAQTVLGGIGTSVPYAEVATLAGWQERFTPVQDGASMSTRPPFVSATDLHLDTTAPTPLESDGAPIAGVSTDYDGDLRDTVTPDIGADEGSFIPLFANDVAAVAFVDPTDPGLKAPGVPFSPQASFQNVASVVQVTVPVRFRIIGPVPATTVVYADSTVIASMPVNEPPQTVVFASVAVAAIGTYTMEADARLPGDQRTRNDRITGTFALPEPLGGIHRVGAAQPAPYNSLTSAINTLNAAGISAPVTFLLDDAVYTSPAETFPVVINAFAGAGPGATLTIRPAPGVTPAIAGTGTGATIRLNGADYVTIDGSSSGGTTRDLTISSASTQSATAAVWLSSLGAGAGATNNAIRNCRIRCGADQSAGSAETFAVICSGSQILSQSEGADNDNNTIVNNEVVCARWGIYVHGSAAGLNDNVTISDNLIGPAAFGVDEIGLGGIVVQYVTTSTISRNEVRFVGGLYAQAAAGANRVGIGLGDKLWGPAGTSGTTATSSIVTRNRIHDVVDEKGSALGVLVGGIGAPSRNVVSNNMIYGLHARSQTVGIGIGRGDGDLVVANSVSLTGDLDPTGSSAATVGCVGIQVAPTAPSNLTLKDNIVAVDVTSDTATLKHYAIVAPSAAYVWGSGGANNNDYYVNPANAQMILGRIGTSAPYTDVTNLAVWRAQFTPAQDDRSMSVLPPFVSSTDLHLRADVPTLLESGGTPVSDVTTDFDENPRQAMTPDIGADEGVFAPYFANDVAAVALVDPTSGGAKSVGIPFSPQATFQNLGTAVQTNVPVRYRIIGPGPATTVVYADSTVVASMPVNGSPRMVAFAGVTLATGGTYTMEAKAAALGDLALSNDQITGSFAVPVMLAGTFHVGAAQPPPFNTLTGALSAIAGMGASGPVTFLLDDAVYTYPAETFPIVIQAFAGAGSGATLTIRPAPGVTAAISGTGTSATIKLNGADYVNIDGSNIGGTTRDLTISNASTQSATAAVWLSSLGVGAGATHNAVRNCRLFCGADQSTGAAETFGVISSGSQITNGSYGADNDDNSIANNEISRVRWGICVYGSDAGLSDNVTIVDNLVGPASFGADQIGRGGIVVQYVTASIVCRNEVRSVGCLYAQAASFGSRVGIGLGDFQWTPYGTTVIGSTVTGNFIHDIVDEKAQSVVGLLVAGVGTPSSNVVANNMVYDVRSNGRDYDQAVGLGIGRGDGDLVVANSIAMTGDLDPPGALSCTASCAGIRLVSDYYTVSNLTLKNNIVAVDVTSNTPTLQHYAIVAPFASYVWGSGGANNNDYYVNASNSQMVLGGLGDYVPYSNVTTLAGWRAEFAPAQDGASVSVQPPFVSGTDLHLQTGVPTLLESGGSPIAGVTIDYDGDLRSAVTPDIGADEGVFTSCVRDVASIAFVDPAPGGTEAEGVPFSPQATFLNTATASLVNVSVRLRISGPAPATTVVYADSTVIASMPANGRPQVALFASVTISPTGTYTMEAKSLLPGDQVPGNDQITGSLAVQGMLTHHVGVSQPAPYTTLTSAINTLSSGGISSPVTFLLDDAVYTSPAESFPIVINAVAGAGPGATLTIRPAPGVTAAIVGTGTGATIKLNGAGYVTIDGSNSGGPTRDLTISTTSTQSATAAVWLSSLGAGAGATNNTIRNCRLLCGVDQSAGTAETFGVISSGGQITSTSDGSDNDNNVITSNEITRARWGVFVRGASADLNDNVTISDNLIGPAAFGIDEIGRGGIVVQYVTASAITHNEVRSVGGPYTQAAGGGSRVGIGLGGFQPGQATTVTGSIVSRNLVHDIVEEKQYAAAGIIVGGSGTPSSGNTVTNNMVYGVRANSRTVGISIGASSNGDLVANNSVLVTGDLDPAGVASCTVSCAGIAMESASNVGVSNLTLKNNVIAVDVTSNMPSLKHYAVVAPPAWDVWGSGGANNNDYYVNPANAQMVLGGIGTSPYTDVTTIAQWRTRFAPAQEGASVTALPPFISTTDLHLRTDIPTPLESGGTPIAWVVADYDGDPRQSTTPDIGADEGAFAPYLSDVAAVAFVDPTASGAKAVGLPFSPQAGFQNVADAAQTNVPVRYRIIGPVPATTVVYADSTVLASMPANGTPQTVTFASATIGTVGTYTIEAKARVEGDLAPSNDQITGILTVQMMLAGAYHVGASQPGPYNTLTSAINALNAAGTSSPVTFLLDDAVYTSPAETFPIVINAFAGAGPGAPLTIRPAPGVTAAIVGTGTGQRSS